MIVFGFLLIILGAPLLLGYAIGEKKNRSWRNLGFILLGIGAVIAMIPQ